MQRLLLQNLEDSNHALAAWNILDDQGRLLTFRFQALYCLCSSADVSKPLACDHARDNQLVTHMLHALVTCTGVSNLQQPDFAYAGIQDQVCCAVRRAAAALCSR